jgi:hypothetical protein
MKVKLAVAKLFLINKTIAGLTRAAAALRPIVLEAGNGEYGKYRVLVCPVSAHVKHVSAHYSVRIERI